MAVDADAKRLLSDEEITAALADLPGWERQGDKLAATFNFSDFSEAFGFMSRVALISERLFHHPEWSNVWSTVEIAITNHAAGGLTELDLEFARRVNALV
ncbi:MAG: 4a-hydroxytetrahydrobiopterin dehydratase [Acidimicrobiia bacterium]|nr:4a-hydroxytetrahydrobiopterin dehydratase [bacterium]MXW58320.1 4a-hydroxytetrahydrobiopterin dehydratase [Acidimicrobiia bacterium]MXZ78174.1 4a-hydroxytetrahydrobiopterin dehydratase [Acidimicrobiia bacterium]MXZ86389.1 4a-hydroxytetrahydrobiopterin dehydratase [Acidimicrobiia bacterium]MYB73902.1 4a-hydroxytetrahydrobiopterin dehydratase [Acidimicrobiia bacterium]